MILPTLYKNKQQWVCVVIKYDDYSEIIVTFGQINGKQQTKITTINSGKNIGKANETTHYEQACLEAQSKWNKQKDKLYSESPSSQNTSIRPMLAQSYDKYSHKIMYPCFVQPKLDGCLSGDSLIRTKEYGLRTIQWIVDNKLKCKVASYKNNKILYNNITNWFLNRDYDESVTWYEIILETGEKLKLTGNHKVYLPDLKCYRRVDELDGNENLMVI